MKIDTTWPSQECRISIQDQDTCTQFQTCKELSHGDCPYIVRLVIENLLQTLDESKSKGRSYHLHQNANKDFNMSTAQLTIVTLHPTVHCRQTLAPQPQFDV